MKNSFIALLISMILLGGCYQQIKTEFELPLNTELSVQDAKNWFESNIINVPNARKADRKYVLYADWKKAFSKKNLKNNSETVSVPIIYTENGKLSESTLNNLSPKFYNDRQLPNVATTLLISKDKKGKIDYELIDYIPDKSSTNKFSGYTIVSNWDGEFIRGYKVEKGIVMVQIYSQDQKKKGRSSGCGGSWIDVSWDQPFFMTDGEGNLTGIGVIHHSSSYFVESNCDSAPPIDFGGNGGNDQYGDYGGGGVEAIPAGIIRKNESIANHPKFNCIYEKLRYGNEPFNSLIGAFNNNLKWNLEFKLTDNLTSGGKQVNGLTSSNNTVPFVSSNVTIELNQTALQDFHSIWIAKTFLHEAFHAYLIQMVYENVGAGQVTQWRVKPEQSELLELMKYIEEVGIQESHHEYMANNLETMVTGMKQFVAKEYPLTYHSIYTNGGGDSAFYALCLAGLEGTNFYQKYLTDKNLIGIQMSQLRNNFLNSSEKPNCYE